VAKGPEWNGGPFAARRNGSGWANG